MVFAFGDHELDDGRFELRRSGRVVELQPKALELLLHLVRNHDRVVSKRELLEAVWPDAVVTDGSLVRAVSLARRALDDRGRVPGTILTVPRRGYRFGAPVREVRRAPAPPSLSAVRGDEEPSTYIGRAQLLERLGDLLDAALAGRGRILFLAGEAGVGKTRTAEVLAERARRAGAVVATAWGLDESDPIHWTWTRALRALATEVPEAVESLAPARRADLARLLPELAGETRDAAATAPASESARFRLFEAVQALLARAARAQPIALFLDDLHGADAESLWLLEFVGQTIAAAPIAIVATCRDLDVVRAPQQSRALEHLLRLTALERWSLANLDGDEVRAFVGSRLGREPDAALVEALERKTDGNPLLLGESLRSLEARGLLGSTRAVGEWELLLPRGIRHLLLPKLRRLSPGAIEALACAAAIGVEFDRDLLARSLGDASDLDARLQEAADASLVSPGAVSGGASSFAHVLVRDALYAELAPSGETRRSIHARISATLEARASHAGDPLADRARHACEAVPLVAPDRAVALAQAAGEESARLHEFERAVVWFERALALLGPAPAADPASRTALCLGLGAAQTRALGLERARVSYREAGDHARSVGRVDLLAAAALGFAHRPNSSGRGDPEVIALLEEALRAVPDAEGARRIRLQSRLAGELRYAERPRAEALVDGAVAAARSLGDPAVLAQALDDSTFVRWSPADSEAWIALNGDVVQAATAARDLELVLSGQRGQVTGHLELGDFGAADREIRACERTAEALRTPYARWYCTSLRAMRALVQGDLPAAERRMSESFSFGERVASAEVELELQVQLVYLRVEQGRAGEIDAAAQAQLQRFPDAAVFRAALGRILISVGRLAAARRELEILSRRGFAEVPRDRNWLPTLALASEIAFATGDARSAEALEGLLAPYARLCVVAGSGLLYYGSVAHHLGTLAAARSRWDAAIGLFDVALGREEAIGAHAWAARARIGCARALVARDGSGDRARAARLATDVLTFARARGLAELSSHARELESALWTQRGPAGRGPGGRSQTSES